MRKNESYTLHQNNGNGLNKQERITNVILKNLNKKEKVERNLASILTRSKNPDPQIGPYVTYKELQKNILGSGYSLWECSILMGTGMTGSSFIINFERELAHIVSNRPEILVTHVQPNLNINDIEGVRKYAILVLQHCFNEGKVEKVKGIQFYQKGSNIKKREPYMWGDTEIIVGVELIGIIQYKQQKSQGILKISKERLRFQVDTRTIKIR